MSVHVHVLSGEMLRMGDFEGIHQAINYPLHPLSGDGAIAMATFFSLSSLG